MRATLWQAVAERDGYSLRSSLENWWADWPCKSWRHFWHPLLFAEGSGWLVWEIDSGTTYKLDLYGYEPDEYIHVPPLRYFAQYLRAWTGVPYLMLIGPRDREDGTRYRYSWEEARSSWDYEYFRDPDRKRELWGRY